MGDTSGTNLTGSAIVSAATQRFLNSNFTWTYARTNSSNTACLVGDCAGAVTRPQEIRVKDATGTVTTKTVVGPAIDCSDLVWESMLAAGNKVAYAASRDFQKIAQGRAIASTPGAANYFAVNTQEILAGDIAIFDGHVAIVQSYDSVTGNGTFLGAQSSGIAGNVQFTTNPGIGPYWGSTEGSGWGNKVYLGAVRVKVEAYDPTSATDILNAINVAIDRGRVEAGSSPMFSPSEKVTSQTYAKGTRKINGGGGDEDDSAPPEGAHSEWSSITTYSDGSVDETVATPSGSLSTTTYNNSGNIVSVDTLKSNNDGSNSETTRYSNDRGTRIETDGYGAETSRATIEYNADGRVETVVYADGHAVKLTYDISGTLISQQPIESGGKTLIQSLSTVADALTLIKALQTGKPLPITVSGLRLVNDIAPGNTVLSGASAVGTGILSALSLQNALKRGDNLAALTAGAQTLGSSASAYLSFAQAAGEVSTPIADSLNSFFNSTRNAPVYAADGTLLSPESFNSGALPYLNLVNSIANHDTAGTAAGIADLVMIEMGLNPVVGLAVAVFRIIDSLFGDHGQPDPWGSGNFIWNATTPDFTDVTFQADGQTGGDTAVSGLLNNVLTALNALVVQIQQQNPGTSLGLIPNRMPGLGYNMDGFHFIDIDPLSGVQKNPALRYDTSGNPYNAVPGTLESYQTLGQAFILSALARGAIAPLWEVETAALQTQVETAALLTQQGNPQAGLSEEERAGDANDLAAPVSGATQTWRPIVLDVDGNGIQTLTQAQSNVAFDVDDSGYLKNTAWINANDAFLTLDRNINGSVDSGRELFSNGLVGLGRRGLAGLAWVDSNAGSVIDTSDPVFSQLRLWRDRNGNGAVDAGEQTTLAQDGITSLNYAMGSFVANGQTRQMASQDLQADTLGLVADVVPQGILAHSSAEQTSLLVTRVNQSVVATADSFTTFENGGLYLKASDLVANDTFEGYSGTGLTVDSVLNAQHGRVLFDYGNVNGNVIFYPDANYWGAASFEYVAKGTNGQTATATVRVSVAQGNDRTDGLGMTDTIHGTAGVDTIAGGSGNDLLVGGYDRDIYLFNLGDGADVIDDASSYSYYGGYGGAWGGGRGNELRFGAGISPDQIVATNNYGTLTLVVKGTSDSIRLLHWVGGADRVDSFVFPDGTAWNAAHVESIITPPLPLQLVANTDHLSGKQNTELVVKARDLLVNDTYGGLSGQALTLKSIGGEQHGVVSVDALGMVHFQPATNFVGGEASFDYVAQGPNGQTATTTVHVSVAPPILPPPNDRVQGIENIELIISAADLLANDKIGSLAGQVLTLTDVPSTSVRHGSAYVDVNGMVHFTPEANYSGDAASFDYQVRAADGQTAAASVQVLLTPVNQAPTLDHVDKTTRTVYGYLHTVTDATGATVYGAGIPIYRPYFIEPYASTPNYDLSFLDWYPDLQWTADIHTTPLASEDTGTGRVVGKDVDDTVASLTYQVVAQPRYGSVSVNTDGTFQYTGWKAPGVPSDAIVIDGQYAGNEYEYGPYYYAGNLPLRAVAPATDVFRVSITDSHGASTTQSISVPHYGPYFPPMPVGGGSKPIVIDLDQQGFSFTNLSDSNVFLDVNGDGWKHRISWISPGEGLLAYDPDSKGAVTEFSQIALATKLPGAQTDLQGLAAFDNHQDGVFDKSDAAWSKFGIWRDSNQNGISDPGEFKTLDAMGVASISLVSDNHFSVVNGNTVHGIAMVTMTDGTTRNAADVTLAYSPEVQVPHPDGSTTVATPAPFSPSGEEINGTNGADLLLGKTGNGVIKTLDGNDVVFAGDGSNLIQAGNGNDVIYAGDGDDLITAGNGDNVVYTGRGTDVVIVGDGNNAVFAEGGNDIVFAGNGNNLISGGPGNVVIRAGNGDNTIDAGNGNTAVFVGDGDNLLIGGAGINRFQVGSGNNRLVAGSGAATLIGGTGNNNFVINSPTDDVQAKAGGVNTVEASISYTLPDNVQNLTLTGTDKLDGKGNALDNVLIGNAGSNVLTGGAGVDTFNGGAGADTLVGGYDRDIYLFKQGDGFDTIDDALSTAQDGGYGGAWGGGNGNELRFGVGISPNQIAAVSHDGTLTLAVRGTSDRIRLLHWVGGTDRVDSFVFADGTVWNATHVESIMTPNIVPLVLTPIGHYDGKLGQAIAFRIPDGTFSDANSTDTLALSVQLENGNQLPAWLSFDAATHTLSGTPGSHAFGTYRIRVTASDPQGATVADVFDLTVAGLDTAPVVALPVPDQSTAEDARFNYTIPTGTFTDVDPGDHLTLSAQLENGNALPSWLSFDAATQTLSGTPGNSEVGASSVRVTATDTHGLAVSDVFNLAVTNVNDAPLVALPVPKQTVVENAGFNYTVPTGTFTDVDLGDRLTLSATLSTGNPLPSWLKFDAASATFSGSPGIGNLADYSIRLTARDLAGTSVAATFNLSVVAAPGVSLLGTAGANSLTGLSGNDTLNGGAGADTLIGGKGDDIYYVDNTKDKIVERKNEGMDTAVTSVDYSLPDNVETLTLTGKSGLKGTGNDLDNIFRGSSGKDTFTGGKGDDTYYADSAKDKVVERKNEGKDTIVAGIDYSLPENVENLVFTGTAGRKGTGNTLDNSLSGTAGNDSLDGDSGADTLKGGAGNDSYYVDNVGDRIVELAGAGIDSVASSVSYTLPDNVENLTLTDGKNSGDQHGGEGNDHNDGGHGQDAMNGTGNALANTIFGDSGANTLDGRDGNDMLTGGKSNDTLYGGNGDDILNGDAGSDAIDGNGGLDFLEGMAGNDTLSDTAGGGYFNGGTGDDKLTGGATADFFMGGRGDDTINSGGGDDVIVFNHGDGHDMVTVGANARETISLGGGIEYRDLKFKKSGNNLVLTTGDEEDGIEFVNWYAGSANRNVLNLQVVAEAMDGFNARSTDALVSKKVQNFDFKGLAGAFDAARAAKPGLSSWALTSALTQFHLATSDSSALGGDLAYQYGKNGTLSGIGLASAQEIIGDAQFGAQAQALKPLSGLREGAVRLT